MATQYVPFASWSDVLTHASEGRRILYHAPLDRSPCDVRVKRVFKNGKLRVNHIINGDFTIDASHLDRMRTVSGAKPEFSMGHAPTALITRLCREQCPNGYPMTLRSQSEWAVLSNAWNQGIDSHLEALTERSSADECTGEVNVHPDELHVLLRRLYEDGSDEAWSLRSDILSTLGITEF